MTDDRQYDLMLSRMARDVGLAKTQRESFSGAVERVVDNYIGDHVTGEDIRRICATNGVSAHSPNVWGGVVSGLIRKGRLKATGEYRQMTDVRSHARETKVYEVVV